MSAHGVQRDTVPSRKCDYPCDPSRHIYWSLRALRAQSRKKISKQVFLAVPKVPEDTPESQKRTPKIQFSDLFCFFGGGLSGVFSETGVGGGQNVPNARGGGELAPKVVLGKLGLLTPKLTIFYRISVERRQIQGPPKFQNFHPPSNFRRFDPYPGLQYFQGLFGTPKKTWFETFFALLGPFGPGDPCKWLLKRRAS